jgi:hypothetical protein
MLRVRDVLEELSRWDMDCLVSGDITVYSGQPHEIHIPDVEAHRLDVYAGSSGSPKRSLRYRRQDRLG